MMLLNSSTWMDVIIILYRFVSTEPYFVGMSQVIQPGVVLQNLSSELGFLLSLSSVLHAHMEIAKSSGPAVLITIISQDKGCLCVVLKNRILTQNASWKELNQI